ncbi:MAG: efflux RND transporter periplasmic adaptor subunit [Halioglobus sp.]
MLLLHHSAHRTAATLLLFTTALGATPGAAQPQQGVPVTIDTVREQPVQRLVQLTGSVTSARSARLSTATGGLVTALAVDAGSQVAAGDVLLELDPALAQWQWQSAQASAAAARIALADARRRLEEARKLALQFTVAESVVRDLEAEAAQDEAELQRAEAEAGYRRGVLDRHQLRAPFAGVVSAKQTELGEWVDPGQPVLSLVSTQELRMDFPVAEDYVADVGLATPVTYTLGDDAGDIRTGSITTIVPVTDPGARTFLLRVQAGADDERMIPGMSARARLALAAGRSGLTVPRDAILKFPDGRVVVWVIDQAGDALQVNETLVTTGEVFEGRVEIRAGLQAGDRIVVRGNEALQNGQRVVVLPAAPG